MAIADRTLPERRMNLLGGVFSSISGTTSRAPEHRTVCSIPSLNRWTYGAFTVKHLSAVVSC